MCTLTIVVLRAVRLCFSFFLSLCVYRCGVEAFAMRFSLSHFLMFIIFELNFLEHSGSIDVPSFFPFHIDIGVRFAGILLLPLLEIQYFRFF